MTPDNQSKALSPADFPNWLLTQFGSVDEVRKAVESGAVVIAPTVLDGWGPVAPPFHYVVYDKTGASLVIEPVGGKLVVNDNPLGVLTNSPSFDWHMTNLRNYIALNPRNVPAVKIDGDDLQGARSGHRHARPAGRFLAAVALHPRDRVQRDRDPGRQCRQGHRSGVPHPQQFRHSGRRGAGCRATA